MGGDESEYRCAALRCQEVIGERFEVTRVRATRLALTPVSARRSSRSSRYGGPFANWPPDHQPTTASGSRVALRPAGRLAHRDPNVVKGERLGDHLDGGRQREHGRQWDRRDEYEAGAPNDAGPQRLLPERHAV